VQIGLDILKTCTIKCSGLVQTGPSCMQASSFCS